MSKWVLIALLTACGTKTKIPFWTYSNYSLCELKLNPELESLPFSLVVNLNRYDLERYDARSSSRPWVITEDLEVKDLGSDLIEPELKGQISVLASSFYGNDVYLDKGWIEPQNAMREAVEKRFIINPQTYRYDIIRRNVNSLEYDNLTQDSPGFMNWAAIKIFDTLFFTTIIGENSKSYKMDLDGTNKQPLEAPENNNYGLSISPDGTKYAYNSNYQLYIGNQKIETPCGFNFRPVWSPDSSKIAFLCNNDLYTVLANGSGLEFLDSRGSYDGQVPFTSQVDHHSGGSDRFVWTPEGLIYAKMINGAVELVLNGEQLTFSTEGTKNVYPEVSKDFQWLLYHSNKNLNMLNLETLEVTEITDLDENCNSRLSFWQK